VIYGEADEIKRFFISWAMLVENSLCSEVLGLSELLFESPFLSQFLTI